MYIPDDGLRLYRPRTEVVAPLGIRDRQGAEFRSNICASRPPGLHTGLLAALAGAGGAEEALPVHAMRAPNKRKCLPIGLAAHS